MSQFQEHSEFDDFLRRKMNSASLTPRNDRWERVRKTLFWVRLRRKSLLGLSLLVILGSFMKDVPFTLFSAVISENTIKTDKSIQTNIPNPSPVEQEARKQGSNSLTEKVKPIKQPLEQAIHPANPTTNNNTSNHLNPVIKQVANANLSDIRIEPYKSVKQEGISIPLLQLKTKAIVVVAAAFLYPSKDKESSLYLGWHGIAKNTWIINQNTYNAFKGYEPRFLLDWGHSYGSHIGIKLKNRLWLELSANFLATQGQRYQDVLLGKETYREVNLLYHQASGVVKKEHAILLLGKKRKFYWEVGLQYARLLAARQHINTSDVGIYKRFKEHEVSIILGYSVDWSLSKRLFINTAGYARVGNDINSEGWAVEDKYGKSHNADVGFRLSLNYRLFNK